MNFKDFYKEKLIQEVHYTDVYPKAFQEFYNKWKKYKNDSSLYVRFDNGNTTDVLSKGASQNPNHSDPVGTYAYPLKYIIDYPGDIWYGHNSTYLKVIKDKSKKGYVRLDTMDDIDARNYLRKVGLDDGYYLAQKFYPDRAKGITAPGKLFMSALQMDFNGATLPKDRKNVPNPISPKTRSSKEQTSLLLRMGINTLEDRATRISQASINDREPEQILWLRPTDFEILETYRLSDKVEKSTSVTFKTDKLSRKIAAGIAEIMNDSLTDFLKEQFWTKNGRKIIVSPKDVSLKYRMDNLKMGQKPHKFFKKYNQFAFSVTILSERGEFNELVGADEKISQMLSDFNYSWNKKEGIDNGKRYSKKEQEENEKREKEERNKIENEKRKKEVAYNFDWYVVPRYNELAKYLGFREIPDNLTTEQKVETYNFMQAQLFDFHSEIFDHYPEVNKEILQNYKKILDYVGNPKPWRFPGHNLNDAMEKMKRENPPE